ncbi:MAG: hypothetical protein HQK62_13890 [Desulfamplus sp.]|nr:hypothetical protein [Desulfamplus sp.]MBF0259898.1 hypothetical protein [Desulfamplus sp.]
METELIIIKNNSDYIRVKDGKYFLCNLDKASVFPMDKIEEVKDHIKNIRQDKNFSPSIYRLILKEEPLSL